MDLIYNNSNFENNTQNNGSEFGHMFYMMDWVVFSFGIPATFLAIYLLYFLICANHIAPIFVINLLISDLLQMCVVPLVHRGCCHIVVGVMYFIGLTASVGFMVCIALERYLLIAFPLWYRFGCKVKYSIMLSSIVWLFSFVYVGIIYSLPYGEAMLILTSVLMLIPLPLLIFFLVGTLRALSDSFSVPLLEKIRIIGILALVLGIYCLFFLPPIINLLLRARHIPVKKTLWEFLVLLNPVVDPLLYVFMRRGACPCLERLLPGEHNFSQTTTSVIDNPTLTTVTGTL